MFLLVSEKWITDISNFLLTDKNYFNQGTSCKLFLDDVEDLLAESDSDSAPEDVDFLSSKSTALQQAKDATQQIGLEKAKQKDKRKKQDTLFKEQKVRKVFNLLTFDCYCNRAEPPQLEINAAVLILQKRIYNPY